MEETLRELERRALQELEQCEDSNQLEAWRLRFLGKKGQLTAVLRGMAKLSEDERPRIGRLANEIRDALEEARVSRQDALKEKERRRRLESERLDVTVPGWRFTVGGLHPLTRIIEEIEEIFLGMGFEIREGPEVELDYYNFEALNIPKDHPARDMQDTFYITEEILMRTHTSPMQARTLEKTCPSVPVKIIVPGRVYRRDEDDATHSHSFVQVEGLMVDRGVRMSDLKGVLTVFVRGMFGEDRQIRLRPSYFPFTEPSAEVDVSCPLCDGAGCRVCKGSGWIEILGAGMVHPYVLEKAGYDPDEVSGFAFGLGVERTAMLKYGIDDIRHFYMNDLHFLRQFRRGL
ncbi:phenylalanine--tRNA ligase subunit alpha [Kyrpidia spormannii]|uniref:Phenylalanine--tRNA ligase alpha subunit n=2 Tax=Kyrpidia spormannii TaxID=2055160 RepID=A0A2K8N816_9BACL|nr:MULTISPECIES: phenylalanine--tRNA ligase subunit alpha [Kyrpidia]ATY85496.1 phenylalanine--tRNA ligase subunit alpha [Kyrpidia spormannii]MCL6574936.1 phenylalanine--tRNA ligase subunit alpha [Kyrpidia sp.]CAB3393719.1 phenylalanyl-tRNA synthetase (alpha subunit) [Kyrpidia spormannii]HHY67557.1 phenylalanine--tRNA ligase subunit alpha [Alicyclobacillus sp.]